MSFIYPRTITVRRPNLPPPSAVGAIGYQGVTAVNETVVASNLPASIQHRSGKGQHGYLPADTERRSDFYIFIPAVSAALGAFRERDVVVDDLGNRYQVSTAYWNSLGYRLTAELLQT